MMHGTARLVDPAILEHGEDHHQHGDDRGRGPGAAGRAGEPGAHDSECTLLPDGVRMPEGEVLHLLQFFFAVLKTRRAPAPHSCRRKRRRMAWAQDGGDRGWSWRFSCWRR